MLLLSSKMALIKLTVLNACHWRSIRKWAPAEPAATFARIAEEATEAALLSANKPPP